MIKVALNTEAEIWCFCKNIFFYAFPAETGFYTVSKWVNGIPQHGEKLFPMALINRKMTELYEQVYLNNN